MWEAIPAGVSGSHGAGLFCPGASLLGPHRPSSFLFTLPSLRCSPARRLFQDLYVSNNFLSSASSPWRSDACSLCVLSVLLT